MAGEQQQDAIRHQLVLAGEDVALEGLAEAGQQVVGWGASTGRHQAGEVAAELLHRPTGSGVAIGAGARGDELAEVVRPALEPVNIGVGHAEEAGDHERRQRVGDVTHQPDPVTTGDCGDEALRHLANEPGQRHHTGVREPVLYPGAVGRAVEYRPHRGHASEPVHIWVERRPRLDKRADGADRRRRCADRAVDLGVAREDPATEVFAAVHRVLLPEDAEHRVRVTDVVGIGQIEDSDHSPSRPALV